MGCLTLIWRWFLLSVIIAFIAWLLPGVHVDSLWTIMCFSAAWGLINFFVIPILQLISWPIAYYTLGLSYLVINTIMVLSTSWIVDGFKCDGFWWALLFSVIYTIVATILGLKNYKNSSDDE